MGVLVVVVVVVSTGVVVSTDSSRDTVRPRDETTSMSPAWKDMEGPSASLVQKVPSRVRENHRRCRFAGRSASFRGTLTSRYPSKTTAASACLVPCLVPCLVLGAVVVRLSQRRLSVRLLLLLPPPPPPPPPLLLLLLMSMPSCDVDVWGEWGRDELPLLLLLPLVPLSVRVTLPSEGAKRRRTRWWRRRRRTRVEATAMAVWLVAKDRSCMAMYGVER